jgi:hypothetical protein
VTRNIRIAISALMWLLSPAIMADTTAETEIQYLLESIGQSQCVFVRNGETHVATEAESHLRMKYRNGKFWVNSAEQFIKRIASKSSWSGDPYYIDCPDTDRRLSGDWLLAKLAAHRKTI